MADLRVFVSSTCYDLAVIREQLRAFLQSVGHSPIMSDYSDVLYDPRNHTHTSCVAEVDNCDIVLVIVGGRFGGAGVPEAVAQVDFDKMKLESASQWLLEHHQNVSITQLEVLRAIEHSIPVFAFIDEQVWHDHLVYEKNKSGPIADKISFPSIDKAETARYVFEFINFLRHRNRNNAIHRFGRFEDITSTLRKQWSALFQRLLSEIRHRSQEARSTAQIADQLESLKAAVLSSIATPDARDVARGVVRFRRLIDFLVGLQFPRDVAASPTPPPFFELLRQAGLVKAVELVRPEGIYYGRVYLVRANDTLIGVRQPRPPLHTVPTLWGEFASLSAETRGAIYEAWADFGAGPTVYFVSRKSLTDISTEGEVRDLTLEQAFASAADVEKP